MSVDAASLKLAHPEFRMATNDQVTQAITDAMVTYDPNIFLTRYDELVRYEACHILAMSPYGRTNKLVLKDGTTIYEGRVKQILRSFPIRMTVL